MIWPAGEPDAPGDGNDYQRREEAFGPVAAVRPFSTLAEAIDLVNDSSYGLQAGIYTRSLDAAFAAFRELDVGGVMVNEVPTFRVDLMPYGGMKRSGIGREGLKYAVEEMTEIKLACFTCSGDGREAADESRRCRRRLARQCVATTPDVKGGQK
jgi:acyl-CoA reductase-like NAD-dependent aldehyde dehydrogenase